jgi:hypothetical protein
MPDNSRIRGKWRLTVYSFTQNDRFVGHDPSLSEQGKRASLHVLTSLYTVRRRSASFYPTKY